MLGDEVEGGGEVVVFGEEGVLELGLVGGGGGDEGVEIGELEGEGVGVGFEEGVEMGEVGVGGEGGE